MRISVNKQRDFKKKNATGNKMDRKRTLSAPPPPSESPPPRCCVCVLIRVENRMQKRDTQSEPKHAPRNRVAQAAPVVGHGPEGDHLLMFLPGPRRQPRHLRRPFIHRHVRSNQTLPAFTRTFPPKCVQSKTCACDITIKPHTRSLQQ